MGKEPLPTAADWWRWLGPLIGGLLLFFSWIEIASRLARTTCPTCPAEYGLLLWFGGYFGISVVIGLSYFAWVARKQWIARTRRRALQREEFRES